MIRQSIRQDRRSASGRVSFVAMAALLGFLAIGCGGAAVPHQALNAAEASTRAAEVGGAQNSPKAELYLKYARDGIAKAKQLITEEKNEAARRLLVRAEADAEVALAMAKRQEAAKEAAESLERIEQLMEKSK